MTGSALAAMPALLADLGHVRAALAHRLAAFLAGRARLFTRELVRGAALMRRVPTLLAGRARLFARELVRPSLLVRRMAALAGDLALLVLVHGSEAALALSPFSHFSLLPLPCLHPIFQ